MPPLVTSFSRILMVAVPLYFFDAMTGFERRWTWYRSVAPVVLQMTFNLLLLRRDFRRRLDLKPVYAAERQPLPMSDS